MIAPPSRQGRIGAAAVALIIAAALCMALFPSAAAATIWLQGATEEVYASAVVGPNSDDVVTVSGEGSGAGAMYVFDNPGGLTATSPCVLRSPTEGACPATGRTKMTVQLGNGENRFRARLTGLTEEFALARVNVDAGRDADVLNLSGLPEGVRRAKALSGGGPDRIIGGPAAIDAMNGSRGDDLLIGSDGRDRQIGGPGSDVLVGRSGGDRQTGGTGRDKLRGGRGRDYLDAGAGADLLIGGAGFDLHLGGGGFDRALRPLSRAEIRRSRSIERFG